MCNLMSYNVEIKKTDFVLAANMLNHMKIMRTGKNFVVIETTRHDRMVLTRSGISFTLVETKDDEEGDKE
jgi:hypothetical protein